MIHTNRIVTVGEQECIIDRPIVLYRGDREVEIEFTLVGNEFMFSEDGNVIKSVNASHGQLVLNTPSGEHMFSELAECHEGKVVFVVTKEMIDEFIEMGFYSFQIRLYDSAEMKSRVTIPPVLSGFDIRNPIAAEDETNVVDQGIVDYARIFKDQSNEELPTFDWQGNYNKTEWAHHDVITENKMNKIEDALYSINANVKESDVVMLNTLDQVKKDADKYVKEHMAEVEAEVDEFERSLNTGVEKFKVDTNAAITAHKNEVNSQLAQKANNITFEECVNLLEINDLTLDDQIEQCITYSRRNYVTLTFKSNKTYEISKPIKIANFTNDTTSGKSQNIDFNNCIIKAMTEMEHMILVNTSSNPFGSIKNVTLDCNNLALDGIRVAHSIDFRIDDFYIKNFKRYGIRIAHTDTGKNCGSAFYNNGYIKNETGLFSDYTTIGIYTDGADSHFSNIKIRNTDIGVFNNNGVNFYDKVHGYMTDTNLIPDSIFMQIGNGGARLNQCYADTYYISYQINSLKAKVYLNGCYNFWLNTYYPETFNKPIIFNFEKEQANVGEEIIVNGMYASKPSTFDDVLFCNLENLNNWSDTNMNMEDNNQLASCINYPNGKKYGELTLMSSQKDNWDIHYNELLKVGKTVYCRVRMSLKSGIILPGDSQFSVFSFPAGFRPLYNKPFVTHSILSTAAGANSYMLPTFIENSSSTNTLKIRTPLSPNSNSNTLYICFNYECN